MEMADDMDDLDDETYEMVDDLREEAIQTSHACYSGIPQNRESEVELMKYETLEWLASDMIIKQAKEIARLKEQLGITGHDAVAQPPDYMSITKSIVGSK